MTTRTKNISGGSNKRTVYTILLSVCLFLGVICACLLVALILIGRNLATQSLIKDCQYDNSTTSVASTTSTSISASKNSSEFYDNNGALSDESFSNDTSNEISVKIHLNASNEPPKYLSTTEQPISRPGWRLPRNVKPIHYDLRFHPDLNSGQVTGKNNITIQITEPLDYIVVHGYLLNVSAAEIYSAETNEKINVINFHNDSLHQFWVVDLEDTLQPGIYYLLFEFSNMMTGKRVGMYLSNYLDQYDNRRYIATTKFEPTYARQAFPCFDEPNYKARYTIHIEKPIAGDYIALSNMDVSEITPVNNMTELVTFNTSVPMSTYVTCFIVCDFKYSESVIVPSIGKNITLRVYATPAQVNKTQFALDVAEKVTKYYVDYFQIEYPLPKLDMIAIPDFVSGAMEHWGLVTYRETALLFDEKTSNAVNKQRVATVVAHELAHQWFGNLVTLDWWNDLWLNEGFATYMQFKAIDKILDDWGMVDQFLIDQVHPVMDFDATVASHPIVQTVSTPDQITEIFDSISYNKGAAILRMLENAIGEEKFSQGINKYLTKHKYGNAVTMNLWDQLQTTDPGFDVKEVMDTWITQMGYPVITIRDQNDQFVLEQKLFLTDPSTRDQTPITNYDYLYTIPITYISDVSPKVETNSWFKWNDKTATITKPTNSTWMKLNYKGSGYYRVNYPRNYWLQTLALHIQEMEVSDRASLLDDVFALSKAGELRYETALEFSKVLESETIYVPWSVGIKRLSELKPLLSASRDSTGDDTYTKYKKHGQILLKPIYTALTWDEKENESHQNKLLRGKVLSFGCSFGMEDCLTTAKNKFNAWLNKNEEIQPNLRTIVYSYGMQEISSKDWHKVLNEKYMPETDAQEKMKLLLGLASTRDGTLLNELIRQAENPNVVRSQDFFTCLQYISNNEAGTLIVWTYVKNNWEKLVERFGLNDRYLGQLIPAITSTFTTQVQLEEMESFFAKYPDAGAGAISRKKALENVKYNIKWVGNYLQDVEMWINANIKD